MHKKAREQRRRDLEAELLRRGMVREGRRGSALQQGARGARRSTLVLGPRCATAPLRSQPPLASAPALQAGAALAINQASMDDDLFGYLHICGKEVTLEAAASAVGAHAGVRQMRRARRRACSRRSLAAQRRGSPAEVVTRRGAQRRVSRSILLRSSPSVTWCHLPQVEMYHLLYRHCAYSTILEEVGRQ